MAIRVDGFDYSFDPAACPGCKGRCCRGASGIIRITPAEIEGMAAYLHTNIVDFVNTYLVRRANMLTIKEKQTELESTCIFFDMLKNRCTVYTVRPAQCRTFPFWDHFKVNPELVAAECPGVRGLGVSRKI